MNIAYSLVAVAYDLVLEVTKESSLLLGLGAMSINNPFLIFEKVSVFLKSLVDVGGSSSMGSSGNSL
jgi:hypothetical protein